MKQFAAGTAVLQTPRPITFELDFFAAVAAAAAACEAHTRFSLRGRDGLPHPIWGSLALRLGSGVPQRVQEFEARSLILDILVVDLISAVLC